MAALCGLFYGSNKMATDVDVQYFSHLNGLTLGNNWGDLIRLLDKALVTGIDFTQITAASIDEQGDVKITLYAAHNAMLFQVVELSGFTPVAFNQKYRIKGVPSTTELILKPHTAIAETSITTVGAGKLASLGYEIIFRDANDVKRVYRAKNPTAQHPFIRVDESLTSPDGTTGVYTSTYAKYAMVGLLEHMEHIDDFNNPNVLQLPLDTNDLAKNWKIVGTGTGVVRGWSRWYWSSGRRVGGSNTTDTAGSVAGNKSFNLIGSSSAFYLVNQVNSDARDNLCFGCGLFNTAIESSVVQPWFLATALTGSAASSSFVFSDAVGCTPFVRDTVSSGRVSDLFLVSAFSEITPISNHQEARAITPDAYSGRTALYQNNEVSALEVPFAAGGYLRGTLPHISYAGKALTSFSSYLSENSIYLSTPVGARATSGQYSAYYFYLGELE